MDDGIRESEREVSITSLLDYRDIFEYSKRIVHFFFFAIGSYAFLFGSLILFPVILEEMPCAILFNFGSACFCVADFLVCYNYIYGTEKENIINRKTNHTNIQSAFSQTTKIRLSICGLISSLLYMVGSVFFTPSVLQLELALYCFTFASLMIMLLEAWKIYKHYQFHHNATLQRSSSTTISNFSITFKEDEMNHETNLTKLQNHPFRLYKDPIGVYQEYIVFWGGTFYFVGSILFMGNPSLSSFLYYLTIVCFTLGGLLYVLAAHFLQYRYFIIKDM
jgi:hypothetical protein